MKRFLIFCLLTITLLLPVFPIPSQSEKQVNSHSFTSDHQLHLLHPEGRKQRPVVRRHVRQPRQIYPTPGGKDRRVHLIRHHAYKLDNHSQQGHPGTSHSQRNQRCACRIVGKDAARGIFPAFQGLPGCMSVYGNDGS